MQRVIENGSTASGDSTPPNSPIYSHDTPPKQEESD